MYFAVEVNTAQLAALVYVNSALSTRLELPSCQCVAQIMPGHVSSSSETLWAKPSSRGAGWKTPAFLR